MTAATPGFPRVAAPAQISTLLPLFGRDLLIQTARIDPNTRIGESRPRIAALDAAVQVCRELHPTLFQPAPSSHP